MITVEYSNKKISLSPYNTSIEKDILIFSEIQDSVGVDDLMNILRDYITGDVDDLSFQEKVGLLFKLRSISIGEEISIKFQCVCKTVNEKEINISNIIKPGVPLSGFVDLFKEINDETLYEFVDVDVDELTLEEFDELLDRARKAQTTFDVIISSPCTQCKELHYMNVATEKFISDSMSEDSIMSLYQSISDLVFFGHYSKLDVESMYPFERTIFMGLLNKTREELAK